MNRSFPHIFYLICLTLTLFVSCSIEKRVYRKGYHVVWNHKRTETHERTTFAANEKKTPKYSENVEKAIVASVESDLDLQTPVRKISLVLGKDTCGDKIFFKNGDIINVKVLEVDRENIKYKRCDNLDGPLFTVSKRSLAMLQYANGIKEDLFVEPEKKVQEKTVQASGEKKKTNDLALTSFVLSLLGWLFGLTLIAAIPMAIGSLSEFKREPDKYEGKGLAIAALVISILISSFWAYIFYLIFTSLALFGIPGFNIITVIFMLLSLIALIGLIVMS